MRSRLPLSRRALAAAALTFAVVSGCAPDPHRGEGLEGAKALSGAAPSRSALDEGGDNPQPAAAFGRWSPAATMRTSHTGHTATLLSNGKVLVVGVGGDSFDLAVPSSAELYDAATDTWTSAEPLTLPPRILHTATLLGDGKVLVAGGLTPSEEPAKIRPKGISLRTAYLYDPVTNAWTPAAPMVAVRYDHVATLLGNGMVLVTGGLVDEAPSATAELYIPSAKEWILLPEMSAVRVGHTATILPNGKVLIAGGNISGEAELFDPDVALFNDQKSPWSTAGAMATPRSAHTATLLPDGTVLVVGGISDKLPGHGEEDAVLGASLMLAERYSPLKNSWSGAKGMSYPRALHTATALGDGTVLVVGGLSKPDTFSGGDTDTVELFTLISGTNDWLTLEPMAHARTRHTSTLLPGGKVLVAGGTYALKAINSAEVYTAFPAADGIPCTLPSDCASGSCADGVCCDTPCKVGACDACSFAAGAIADGVCTIVGGPSCDFQICIDDGQCAIGYCVDGVCCNERCDEDCRSCTLEGSVGTCTAAKVGTDPRGRCSGGHENCLGTCGPDGACIESVMGTPCAPTHCADEAHSVAQAVCHDEGYPCPEGVKTDCWPYRCAADSGECSRSCGSVKDCATGLACNLAGKCVAPPLNTIAEYGGCAAPAPGALGEPFTGGPGGAGARGAALMTALIALLRRGRRPRQ